MEPKNTLNNQSNPKEEEQKYHEEEQQKALHFPISNYSIKL